MKALSIRQPWAWLILHGGKDVENRVWNTNVRGEFLIHAAKGMTRDEYEAGQCLAEEVQGYQFAHDMPSPEQLERGGIVGVAELVAVASPLTEAQLERGERQYVWHIPEQYGFILRNARPLPFLPCKGALGFWGNFEIRDGKAVQL